MQFYLPTNHIITSKRVKQNPILITNTWNNKKQFYAKKYMKKQKVKSCPYLNFHYNFLPSGTKNIYIKKVRPRPDIYL